MREEFSLIGDLLKLGEEALGHFMGAREGARDKAEGLAQKLNLVSRREFDAAFGMLAKARLKQEEFEDRLAAIESHLKIAPSQKPKSDSRLKAKKPKNTRK